MESDEPVEPLVYDGLEPETESDTVYDEPSDEDQDHYWETLADGRWKSVKKNHDDTEEPQKELPTDILHEIAKFCVPDSEMKKFLKDPTPKSIGNLSQRPARQNSTTSNNRNSVQLCRVMVPVTRMEGNREVKYREWKL